jgi:hypothetical protein
MEEIWKDIPDYEELYQVSNLGRVKNIKKNTIKKLTIDKRDGYLKIHLSNKKYNRVYRVHQLVVMAFLNHKPCGHQLVVDHINDNKTDNRLENLQVVTTRYNAYKTQGKYSSKYKGVSWQKNRQKWVTYIQINGKKKYLGIFNCELKAHQSYQNALKQYNLS